MGNLLHIIFDKVHKFKVIYLVFALIITLCFGWSISKLHIEEDITRTFPRTEEFKKYEHLYRNSSISGNVVVAIGPRATLGADKLISIGETVATNCAQIDSSLVRSIRLGSDGAKLEESYGIYVRNLPYFLHANEIDSLFASLDENGIHNRLNRTLNRLRSYESIGTKKLLALDPLDMASPVVSRLSDLQSGSALRIEDGYTFTPDGEYLLLILSPSNPPSETVQNTLMVDTLERVVETIRVDNPAADIILFGGPVIAVGNSRQIKKDTALVSWLAGGSILLLLILYFRSLWIPILFFLPPLFGLIFALGIIALWKGSISAISIAAGTIVMGIAIDYCFHFFNHYKETGSVSTTLKEIASPMLLGCFTTVMVFFCLNFLHSQVLADFGTFAGLSLIGTAAFALTCASAYRANWE
jgi:predicted RND superfamily exporter protein